jgi:hypothetical protein
MEAAVAHLTLMALRAATDVLRPSSRPTAPELPYRFQPMHRTPDSYLLDLH